MKGIHLPIQNVICEPKLCWNSIFRAGGHLGFGEKWSFPSLNKSLLVYPTTVTTPYKTFNIFFTNMCWKGWNVNTYFAFILGKNIQGTSPFKVVFQGFSRHLQIQGRFKAFQGFKVVVATLNKRVLKINSRKIAWPSQPWPGQHVLKGDHGR